MSKRAHNSSDSRLSRLAEIVANAGLHLESPQDKPVVPAEPPPETEPPQETASDDEVFARAMENVERTSWKHPRAAPEPPSSMVPADNTGSEERRLMEAAAQGIPAMTVLDHPEYIEGWIGVAGKRFIPNLRNGLYSIQGQIDLHGLSREEARAAVEDFVVRMSRFRSCCVKIIHGRGINSPSDRAVLKESLQRWLSTRRMSRHVVAYASAPLRDGGVGAVYVLLRRN